MFPPDPGPGQHLSRNARISATIIFCCKYFRRYSKYFSHLERDEPVRAGGC